MCQIITVDKYFARAVGIRLLEWAGFSTGILHGACRMAGLQGK